MNITTLGTDIAKSVFQLHGTNKQGKVVLKKRLRRSQLLAFMQNHPPCLVGMEACGGAHYWGKVIAIAAPLPVLFAFDPILRGWAYFIQFSICFMLGGCIYPVIWIMEIKPHFCELHDKFITAPE